MDNELSFCLPICEKDNIISKFKKIKELKKDPRTYEKTIQFKSCDFNKREEGCLELKIFANEKEASCKLLWNNNNDRKEINIRYSEKEKVLSMITSIMNFKITEIFDKHRTRFFNDNLEICVDEYKEYLLVLINNNYLEKTHMDKIIQELDLDVKDNKKLILKNN